MRRCLGVYLLIALAVLGAYAWTGRYRLDMVDEGYFLDMASRVAHGQVPYRDFDTYYTPGIFYLFAGLFDVFGASVLPIRVAMAVVRALTIVLIVRLTVRGAPWPFALGPVVVLLALDRWPIEPEPHPAWPALLASLLAMEALAMHHTTAQRKWLVLAGTAAGVAFLFKQNVGAFTALGVAGYVGYRSWTGLRWAFALLVGFAVSALLRPGAAPFSVIVLWLPVLLALGFVVRGPGGARLKVTLCEGGLATGSFVLVTVAWLIPLAIALRPSPLPLGLFAGAVNQAGLASPYPDLSPGARLLVQLTVVTVTAATKRRRFIVLALAAALLLQFVPTTELPLPSLTDDPQLAPVLDWLNDWFGTLHLYLPAVGAWVAVAGLALDRKLPPWAVLFATLGLLALYPRFDAPHVIVALPLVLIVATWALASLARQLTPRLWAALAVLLIIAVPVAAVVPQAMWRFATFTAPPGNSSPAVYVSLGLSKADVNLPENTAQAIHSTVDYISARTPPGAPLFAYPAVPLFNFLADRPNPTRFDHFFPGALTDADLQQVVDALEVARPRYVVWDHGGVVYWGTDPANRVLSDYVWRCYAVAATFDLYLVLERHEC